MNIEIIFNRVGGYESRPIQCASVEEAVNRAQVAKEPFRIYVNDKLVQSGWFAAA